MEKEKGEKDRNREKGRGNNSEDQRRKTGREGNVPSPRN